MATKKELNELLKIIDPKASGVKNSIIVIETDDKVIVSTHGSILAISSMMTFAMDKNDTLWHTIRLVNDFFLIKEQEEKEQEKKQNALFNSDIIGEV